MHKKENHQKESSSRKKPKLIRYQNKENGLFYFRYEDATGETILTSRRGYASARSRDKGIIHAKANNSNFEIVKDSSQYFFIIKSSGNNAELAKSKPYSKKIEAEEGQQFFEEAIHPTVKMEHKKEKSTINPATPDTKIDSPPRYNFRLTFYPSDDESAEMNGNIEYILGDKKMNFKGLDINTIQTFVKENLPLLLEKQPEIKTEPETSTKKPVKEQVAESTHCKMEFIEDGKASSSPFIHGEKVTEILFILDPEATLAKSGDYEVSVYALSLDIGKKIPIGNKRGFLSTDGKIKFPVFLNQLTPGLYRIMSSLKWPSEKKAKESEMKTSRLVQVFSHEESVKKQLAVSANLNTEFIKETKPSYTKEPVKEEYAESEHLKMEFIEEGKASGHHFIHGKKATEIQLILDAEETSAKAGDCEASVFALSLENGRKILIGNKRGSITTDGQIKFPVMVNQLAPGAYRMLSFLKWHNGKEARRSNIKTSSFVQVV